MQMCLYGNTALFTELLIITALNDTVMMSAGVKTAPVNEASQDVSA